MRAGLALIALLALSATPAVAQGKTKAPAVPASLQVLEACTPFASNNPQAEELVDDMGWDVSVGEGESPFVETINFYKEIAGIGYAEGFVLQESYPDTLFGYCRVDIFETKGEAGVSEIDGLAEWQGEIEEQGAGTFGSWQSEDYGGQRMLLSHEDEYGFVLQLTVMRPKEEES